MSTNSPTLAPDISQVSEAAPDVSAPSPLQTEALDILAAAPSTKTMNLGKAGKSDTADQILHDVDDAEAGLLNSKTMVFASESTPKTNDVASAIVVQDGKQYLNMTDPYSLSAKDTADNNVLGAKK